MRRADQTKRKNSVLWRVNLAALAVLLLLLAVAVAWLVRHPDVQPRGGYAPASNYSPR